MTGRFERRRAAAGLTGMGQALKAASICALGLLAVIVVFFTLAVDQPQPWSGWAWLEYLAGRFGFILPFAAFAGGVAIWRRGPAAGSTRVAVWAGLVIGLASYASSEIVSPLANYAALADGPDLADVRPFGPSTPAGKLRQLRFVEGNPPEQYSLGDAARTPPNYVRFLLHLPVAFVVFSVLNCMLGLYATRLTSTLRSATRRNACLAIGLAGGLGLFAAAFVAGHPNRDWVSVSGVVAAWLPLTIPLLEAMVFGVIVLYHEDRLDWLYRRYALLTRGVRGMPCPDILRVTGDRPGAEVDADVREHIRTCPACQLDLVVVRAARKAFEPDPEARARLNSLNERVLRKIADRRIERAVVRPAENGVTALLGALAAAAAILTAGGHMQPGATTLELALAAAGVGVAAAWAHRLAGRREHTLALQAART